jgi:hypothetical protein
MPHHTLKTVPFLLCLSAIFLLKTFTVEGAAVPALVKKPQKEQIRISPSASVLAVVDTASRVVRDASKTAQQPQARLKDKQTNGKKERRVRSGNLGADINLEGLPPLVRIQEIKICLVHHKLTFPSLFSGYAQVEERTEYDIMVFK